MVAVDSQQDSFIASFATQRQRLVHHAGSLLSPDAKLDTGPDVVAKLSQMLVAALEVLKVAEEELLEERRRNATVQAAQQRRLAHQDVLFDRAPVALLLTTTDSTIRECNLAAAKLLGADARQLEGRQLVAMASREKQAAFREQVGHAVAMGTVSAWSFALEPVRNLPLMVTATVEVVDDPAVGVRALYWFLRPTNS
jgi:PAS domain-containing protein